MAEQSRNEPTLKAAVIPVTPLQQNCSLVWDETSKRGAVVDPGGDLDQIMAAIEQVGMTVEKILLTHGHVDHAAGADELRERLGVEIEGPHKDDEFLLDNLVDHAARFGLEGARNVKPDRWLEEGETVDVAGHLFDLFHCPGHSPGSIVMVCRKSRFALMGDVLFRGSIGRTDFPYGNHDQLIAAIRTKLFPLGDDIVFIPGHGPPSTIGDERRSNPFVGEGA